MNALPAPFEPDDLETLITSLSELPPEHFKLALKVVEAQLGRNHELRMERERNRQQEAMEYERNRARQEVEYERSKTREAANARSHALLSRGLWAGFIVVVGMLTAAVVVGLQGHEWLAAAFAGPGVIALGSLFVLRKIDARSTRLMQPSPLGEPHPDQLAL